MRSSFLPKCKPKITRISALPNKQGSWPKKLLTITKKSPKYLLWSLFVWYPYNFWLAFWAKWWPHKLILNLTDLYYSSIYWKVVFDRKRIETLRVQPWKNLQQKSFDAHKLRITGSIFNNRVRLRLEVQVGHSNQACSNYKWC